MYQYFLLPYFLKRLKKHTKQYRQLKSSLIKTLKTFNKSQAASLGNNVYKIRISTKDLPKGKRNAFRLILYVMEIDKVIVPITIFYKGDQENITKKEVNDHLEIILSELEDE